MCGKMYTKYPLIQRKEVVSRDKMVNIIASFILMKKNLSSLLYQGLLWSHTKSEQLSDSGIQTAGLCSLVCPSHRQGGPGDLLHHTIGSGRTKPICLWLLPFSLSSKLSPLTPATGFLLLVWQNWVLPLLICPWTHCGNQYHDSVAPNLHLVYRSGYSNTS